MTNWTGALHLNNHAVALMESGGAENDGTIVHCLQEAVVVLQHAIQEEMGREVFSAQGRTENQPWDINTGANEDTFAFSSRRIRCFQDPEFFLFDLAFLLFENNDNARTGLISKGRDRNSWIEMQSSVVLFNLGLTFHRRALLRSQYEQQHPQDYDVVLRQNTQVLFSKSKLLYTMSSKILVEHGDNGSRINNDLFQSTKFALRLGIANNMAHIAVMEDPRRAYESQFMQQVAQLIEEGAPKKAATTLSFTILSGIMMNIISQNQRISHRLAAAA
ncbi:hypothetical protein IV203_006394 [Nitzschia inconspicua]|uniref:Uncharacterized protein n=1 Tax=Nitzschia inconspicua TaxID=303405 RepID=A0A9K3K534_9STRA|nr:hypothetical protein IV203_006581 [Nitzschia inconspicua]KAG7339991.1 hypothetical protein IV203_006394 [Nitzschia inconspicua]